MEPAIHDAVRRAADALSRAGYDVIRFRPDGLEEARALWWEIFGRALRLALQHRLVVAASIFCALTVALFWGGNIGAVYPFVEVTFRGQSLQDKVSQEIAQAEQTIAELKSTLDAFSQTFA